MEAKDVEKMMDDYRSLKYGIPYQRQIEIEGAYQRWKVLEGSTIETFVKIRTEMEKEMEIAMESAVDDVMEKIMEEK